MTNANKMKLSITLSYLAQGIQIVSGLLYTPIMLRLLGQSEYGLYQLVASVVSYLTLLGLGFSGSYMRFYSRYKVKKDEDGIASLNGMFITVFLFMMIVAFIIGGIMVGNVRTIFGTGLSEAELGKAKILLFILVINLGMTFPMSVFDCNIIAHEEYVFQKILLVIQNACSPVITLPLLLLGYGSVAMVCVTTGLTFFKLVANIVFCFTKLNMRFSFKNFHIPLLKEIAIFTSFIFINQIVDQINWNLDKFLLGRLAGTIAVAIYAVASQLNSMYIQFSNAIPSVYTARVNMLVAQNRPKSEINKLFADVARIQFAVIGIVISGYIFFGREFIQLWAGNGYDVSYQIGLLLMVPATIPFIQCLGVEIQRAMNMHKARSIVYLIVAASNIFVSIPCIKMWGARGAAIGTAITFIIGHCFFMNIYYQKKMGLDMVWFWSQLKSFLPAYIPIIIFAFVEKKFLVLNSYVKLFAAIGLYSLVYIIAIFLIALTNEERDIIMNKFTNKRK